MRSPKISIVVPSFNKVKYVDKTLQSIVDQNYSNLEVIIQDGGSTDGTIDIIKTFAKKYSQIVKWESRKDKGQLDAINTGFKKATGDILAFINADDTYEKQAFWEVVKAYNNNPNSLWFAGKGIVIDRNGKEIAKLATLYKNFLLYRATYKLLFITNFLMQPSVFITDKAYKKGGPFTGTEDFVMEYDLWLKLAQIQIPTVINKNLSKFRIESTTITKKLSRQLLVEDEKIIKKYTKNQLILFLHYLHNKMRLLTGKFL